MRFLNLNNKTWWKIRITQESSVTLQINSLTWSTTINKTRRWLTRSTWRQRTHRFKWTMHSNNSRRAKLNQTSNFFPKFHRQLSWRFWRKMNHRSHHKHSRRANVLKNLRHLTKRVLSPSWLHLSNSQIIRQFIRTLTQRRNKFSNLYSLQLSPTNSQFASFKLTVTQDLIHRTSLYTVSRCFNSQIKIIRQIELISVQLELNRRIRCQQRYGKLSRISRWRIRRVILVTRGLLLRISLSNLVDKV